MACHECQRARETAGRCAWYCPTCIHCGARLIQRIKRMPGRTNAELSQRMKAVLADWVAYGHSEAVIRRLVAGPMAVQPIGPAVGSASAPRKSGRPR